MAENMAKESLDYLEKMLSRMKLKLNMEKSKTLNATSEPFNFLGFTFRYDKDRYGRNKKYLSILQHFY